MQVVVVSSPGRGSVPHWSHELARELAGLVIERGGQVSWLTAVHDGQMQPVASAHVELQVSHLGKLRPVSAVAAHHRGVALELALTRCLRAWPRAVVVHIGVGAGGTPNVLWLGERLGSRTFACLHGAELVCARGDLVDRDGEPCRDHSDAVRCRWCCAASMWRRPRIDDLRNRTDLLLAGLLTAEAVFVPQTADVALVTGLGVPAARVAIGPRASDLANRIWAAAERA